jgi:cell division protein FtsB
MRIIALSLLALVMLLQYRLWVSDGGMREVWRLRREVAAQQDVNAQLKDRNRTLTAEVQDLKKGKSAVEERARTDLGMVGANETFFQVAPRSVSTTVSKASGVVVAQQPSADVVQGDYDMKLGDTKFGKAETSRPLVGTHASTP